MTASHYDAEDIARARELHQQLAAHSDAYGAGEDFSPDVAEALINQATLAIADLLRIMDRERDR